MADGLLHLGGTGVLGEGLSASHRSPGVPGGRKGSDAPWPVQIGRSHPAGSAGRAWREQPGGAGEAADKGGGHPQEELAGGKPRQGVPTVGRFAPKRLPPSQQGGLPTCLPAPARAQQTRVRGVGEELAGVPAGAGALGVFPRGFGVRTVFPPVLRNRSISQSRLPSARCLTGYRRAASPPRPPRARTAGSSPLLPPIEFCSDDGNLGAIY